MLKAFTPVVTMLLLFLTKQSKPTLNLIIAIFLLSIGTALTSLGVSQNDSSFIGFIYCAGAQTCEAIKLTLKQKLLQGFKVRHNNINNNKTNTNNNNENNYNRIKNSSNHKNRNTSTSTKNQNIIARAQISENSHVNIEKNSHQNINIINYEQGSTDIECDNLQVEEKELAEINNPNVNDPHYDHKKFSMVKFNIFEGLYYYTPITFVFMYILALPLEFGQFMQDYDSNMELIYSNWYLFATAGILGFGTNVAAFLVTKVISALYLKALGTFRNVCLVILAVILFDEIVTAQQVFGYAITLVGFGYYNYVKMKK